MGKAKKTPKMEPKPELTLVKDSQSFFKEMVSETLERQKVKTNVLTEHYLVTLLTHFMHVENLYQVDEKKGEIRDEALANILKAALEAADFVNRQKNLKKLGDVSLYTAGFFSESLSRKTVDVDYYIDMGKSAYSQLSTLIPDDDFRRLFSELSAGFNKFVDVLSEISEKTNSNHSPTNILRMYDLWIKTQSERAEQKLKDVGIIPPIAAAKKIGKKQ